MSSIHKQKKAIFKTAVSNQSTRPALIIFHSLIKNKTENNTIIVVVNSDSSNMWAFYNGYICRSADYNAYERK